jgi:hypothetical protein
MFLDGRKRFVTIALHEYWRYLLSLNIIALLHFSYRFKFLIPLTQWHTLDAYAARIVA